MLEDCPLSLKEPVCVDARDLVIAALRQWLSENKRLDDYVSIARELETLITDISHSERELRKVVEQSEDRMDAPGVAALDQEVAAVERALANDTRHSALASDQNIVTNKRELADDIVPLADPTTLVVGSDSLDTACNVTLRITFENIAVSLHSLYKCRVGVLNGLERAFVDLTVSVKLPGEEVDTTFVEFSGQRSTDLRIDEAKYQVDYDRVAHLQATLMPSLPRPIVFLDLLLSLPLTVEKSPVPFRMHILEDMLVQECWAEESDSEMIADLSLGSDSEPDQGDTNAEGSPPQLLGSSQTTKRCNGVATKRSRHRCST